MISNLAHATKKLPTPLTLGAIALIGALAAQADDADESDWTKNFRIGLAVGYNVSAQFHFNGSFSASGSNPGLAGVSGVNHTFDDGYVLVDKTGDAGGYTSNWGYDQASQYNATTHQLTMRSVSSFTTSGSGEYTDQPFFGFDMAYGGIIVDTSIGRIGWELGFDLLPFSINDTQSLQGSFIRTIDTFNTGGITLPTAPYHGSPSGIGPTILDTASTQTNQTLPGVIGGSRRLHGMLYEVRLGPTLFVPLGQRWTVSAALGPAMGIVPADYQYSETFVFSDGSTGSTTGRFGKTDFQFGGYVSGTVYLKVQKDAEIYAGAQAMDLGSARYASGGREADLKLGAAVVFSIGINWPF